MAFTKESVKVIHSDITAALEAVAKKHNLSMSNTRITFDDATFKFTGQFGDKSETGEVNPVLFKDLNRYGWRFGLTTEDVGKEFKFGADTFKIEGMKGATKVIGKNAKGMYRFDGHDVMAILNRKCLLGDLGSLTKVEAP